MKEEFLHYLWKYKLYDSTSLKDNEGNIINVIHPGDYNHDSGPDFFNARILIGKTVWAGNVEIHTDASQFMLHGHHEDPAYNNVILHVVLKNDKKVYNSRGDEVLTVEIDYPPSIYDSYLTLVNNSYIIACQDNLSDIDQFHINQWIHSLSIERLENKTTSVIDILNETGNDWDEVLYRMICRYFGFRLNSEPFEMLSRSLPFRIIRKHSDYILQIEALLFGSAGMLEEGLFREAVKDKYYLDLAREFRALSSKYNINKLHGYIWKFSRLRPVNFPTIRISQLAHILSVAGGLFSHVIEAETTQQLRQLLEVSASEYWHDHYVFGKKSRKISGKTGVQATDLLIINSIIPVLFVYGRLRNRQDICERAVILLESIATEENKIIREWKTAGINARSAFESQALIQLRNEYCRRRRCIDCRIGCMIISRGQKLRNDKELILEP
ncbi:MAG TPA: DUF2851 family protein [Bacteroidales bacterium]|nr:DUF2851 family protein [Bacteroidales bacterium]